MGISQKMLVFFQFPMADLRRFQSGETGILASPTWPIPNPGKEFVRSFGMVRQRQKGGVPGWVGENEICDANSALKFRSRPRFEYGQGRTLGLQCSSRHFYHDGMASLKFEVVFLTRPTQMELDFPELAKFIDHIISLPIKVTQPGGDPKTGELAGAGRALSRLYLYSSTHTRQHELLAGKAWIIPASPMLFIESGPNESFTPPKRSRRFWPSYPYQRSFCLWQWWVKRADRKVIPVWAIDYVSRNPHEAAIGRNLRLYLMRLHAEYATLGLVLNQVDAGGLELQADSQQFANLQLYFNQATKRISKYERRADPYTDREQVAEIAQKSWDHISPGRREGILRKLELAKIRPQIKDKINNVFNNYGEMTMGDKYETDQAFSVGPAEFRNNEIHVQQTSDSRQQTVQLELLAEELSRLRSEMSGRVSTAEDSMAVGEVAAAELAARDGDEKNVLAHLKRAGKWALDAAREIGVDVAAETIKRALLPG